MQQYDLSDNEFELIFYHFHGFKIINNEKVDLGEYKLGEHVIDTLYKPYSKHLDKITQELKLIDSVNDYNGIIKKDKLYCKTPLLLLRRKLKGTYNIFNKEKLKGK